MSTLFDMALKLLLLLHQEFGAAFQEVTKNVVLLTNLKQKLNFGNQTAFPMIRKVRGFHLISGLGVLLWAHGFCRLWSSCPWICGECALLFLFYFIYLFIYFRRGYFHRGVGWGLCILRGVISKQIVVIALLYCP